MYKIFPPKTWGYLSKTMRNKTKLKMMLAIYWRRLLKLLKSVEDADR